MSSPKRERTQITNNSDERINKSQILDIKKKLGINYNETTLHQKI